MGDGRDGDAMRALNFDQRQNELYCIIKSESAQLESCISVERKWTWNEKIYNIILVKPWALVILTLEKKWENYLKTLANDFTKNLKKSKN